MLLQEVEARLAQAACLGGQIEAAAERRGDLVRHVDPDPPTRGDDEADTRLASTLTSAARPQASHLAATTLTPFWRVLASVIGGPKFSRLLTRASVMSKYQFAFL
jgi:hypothetical protein